MDGEVKMKTVLTIAGSDSIGGAGIQADIKTITAHKVYATSAITALTAQNTLGVTDILNATPSFLASELDAIFTDIYPDAVKIGMVSEANLIEVIYNKLKEYNAKNIVLDPVMVATSGAHLLNDNAIEILINKLLPLATIITPNIPEAMVLSNMEINNKADMEKAILKIRRLTNASILLKGGHSVNDSNDLLLYNDELIWFNGEKINNPNTHGTGCTLSSAIASNLALGYSIKDSIKNAKDYISECLKAMLNLGKGSGPLDHMAPYRK